MSYSHPDTTIVVFNRALSATEARRLTTVLTAIDPDAYVVSGPRGFVASTQNPVTAAVRARLYHAATNFVRDKR